MSTRQLAKIGKQLAVIKKIPPQDFGNMEHPLED